MTSILAGQYNAELIFADTSNVILMFLFFVSEKLTYPKEFSFNTSVVSFI